MRRTLLVSVMAAACGGGGGAADRASSADPPDPGPQAPPPAPAPDAAPTAPALTVEVDGQPLSILKAIAIPDGDDVEILLVTWDQPCTDLSWIPEGGQHLALTIRRKLRPDGSWSWTHFGTYFESRSSEGGLGEPLASAAVDTTPGGRVRFALDAEIEAFNDSPPLSIHGTVDAETCPARVREPETPPPAPQPDAFVEVAGAKVPIVGAGYLKGTHGFQVMVSSAEVRCEEGPSGLPGTSTFLASSFADVELKLEHHAPSDAWSASLDGGWIDTWHGGDGAGLEVSPPKQQGKGAAALTLSGAATIGGYPVAWSGTVRAIVCD